MVFSRRVEAGLGWGAVLPCVLACAVAAQAQLVDPRVTAARQQLDRYELRGESTYETLAELTRLLAVVEPGPDEREARFLRAVAATDLWILAARAHEASIEARLADSLGVPTDGLAAHLEGELARLHLGAYEEGAVRASRALAALRAIREGGRVRIDGLDGARRDALLLEAVHQAVAAGGASLSTLASMASSDPCAELEEDACPLPFRPFDAEGRRAVSLLSEVEGALDRLEKRAAGGDPFARELAWSVPTDRIAFDGLEVAPAPRAVAGFVVVGPGGLAGAPPRGGVVVDVGADLVRWAFLPRARFTAGGVELVADGDPALPGWAELPMPRAFRPFVLPIDALVEAFADTLGQSGVSVVVTAGPDVPAHVLSRVFLSLRRAGVGDLALFGRAPDGRGRRVPVRLVRGDDAEHRGARHLFVRLGGYSLQTRGGGLATIPRVRGDDGFAFDLPALVRALEGTPRTAPRSLSFMSVVPSDVVGEAAFGLSAGEPLTWIVP